MNNNILSLIGKIPPQAPDLEDAVLGALMLEPAYNKISDILKPEAFYSPGNGKIYEAIRSLTDQGEAVDILTVTQWLRQDGSLEKVGGPLYISKLTSRIASTANIEVHSRLILQQYIKREVIRLNQELMDMAYEDTTDPFDLVDLNNSRMNEILQANVKADASAVGSLAKEVLEDVAARTEDNKYVSGLPTYINSADRVLYGYAKTDLIYLAARPGMGKSAFIISNALQQAIHGHPVAIFSLEMSKKQVMFRLLSQLTKIDLEVLMKRALDQDRKNEINRAMGTIERLPIYIDDTPALSVYDFRAKTARLRLKHNIEAVYVDYVQLMTLGQSMSKKMAGNREQEVSTISRTLKQVAKECDIPVIALVQLSRAVETRGGAKKPILSDMRDSGSLEQDADIVSFLYRPEYYGFTEGDDGRSTKGMGQLIIAKNRNGRLGVAEMQFIEHLAQYTDFGHSYVLPDTYNPNKTIEPNTEFIEQNNPPGSGEVPF